MSSPDRLAVFGGVYANDAALAAVLADLGTLAPTHAWCLGDLGGFGPQPAESVARLRASGVSVLQGNYDHSIGHGLDDCACGYHDPEDQRFAQLAYDFTAARIGDEDRAWMRALPREARLTLGGRRVLLFHGSPRRQNEFLWDSTCSDAFLTRLLDEHDADVAIGSHTGLHWHRALPDGRHWVNCGAIGRPAHDGRPGAWYAVVEAAEAEWRVGFRFVRYDHEALAREIEAAGLPSEFATTARTGWWTTCLGDMPARERRAATAHA
jgi:predicted phosphodiesterase